jgi:hypothetical protein
MLLLPLPLFIRLSLICSLVSGMVTCSFSFTIGKQNQRMPTFTRVEGCHDVSSSL